MGQRFKIKRNDSCPCGSGKKYKYCCEGKTDWNQIIREGKDWIPHLSIRGRDILFIDEISKALQFDTSKARLSLKEYKAAFTDGAVRRIHEAIMEVWPPDMDIKGVLRVAQADVTGLYIGDYRTEFILKGLVRHSIYADKLLVVDPFVYPRSVRDEFNPILTPEQYRSQTLKNVNFWFSLVPWIKAGIVEIIRTPNDFDRQLNWDSIKRQQKKFEENEELKKALEESTRELKDRGVEEEALRDLILSAPNDYLEKVFRELALEKNGISLKDFIAYIEKIREENPNFLEPFESGKEAGQLHMLSSGASYDIAKLTTALTGSYLVTDIYSKWKEIEIDRESHHAENNEWTPFAKAFQSLKLKYLDNLSLEHALILRKEERLESLRVFLRKVWRSACTGEPFSEANAKILAEELREEVKKAEQEWKQIDSNLLKWFGAELSGELLAAGPLIASGYANFLAAAMLASSGITLAVTHLEEKSFQDKFPAAFFMRIK